MKRLVSLTPRPSSAYSERTRDHLQAVRAYKELCDAGVVQPKPHEIDEQGRFVPYKVLPEDVQRELLAKAPTLASQQRCSKA